MQVNAISFTGLGSKYSAKKTDKKNNENSSRSVDKPGLAHYKPISNDSMTNAAKALFVAIPLAAAAGGLTGCEAEAYAYAYANDTTGGCKHNHEHIYHGKDTVTVHDTITQIIENNDTIYIKQKFDSPVIDALRDFFEANDIPLGDGRIPLLITWVDEIGPKYNKQVFDQESSSVNELSYDEKSSPWSDETGSFIIGTPLDDPSKIKYSLTGDGKLIMMRYVPKNGISNPQNNNDWMYSNSAIYDINKNDKVVNRYKYNDENDGEFAGTFEPGDRANTIKVTNPYGTDWRYTNVKVVTGDAPEE